MIVHTLLTVKVTGSDLVLWTLCLRLRAYVIAYCSMNLIVTATARQDCCGLYRLLFDVHVTVLR